MRRLSYTAILIIFVGLIGWFAFSSDSHTQSDTREHAYLQINGRCLRLAVAKTAAQKRRGLSDRSKLEGDQGMLFTYDQPGNYGFWMKDMDFEIDIIWLDERDQVVTVKRSVSPESYPETFYPTKSAKNVIEVASGTAESHDIKSSNRLELVGPTTTQPQGC